MLEILQNWLPIVSALLGIVITAIGFIIPLCKSEKAKKVANSALKITEVLKDGIIEAEKFVNYTGAEKKEYVITKANQYAIKNNIDFNEEAVSEEIETLVDLTRKVNKRPKDIEAEKKLEQQKVENEVINAN